MLPIGTVVYHDGHGRGVVVSYNGRKPLPEIPQLRPSGEGDAEEVAELNRLALAISLTPESIYSGDRYPYRVRFDCGYEDVYGEESLSTSEAGCFRTCICTLRLAMGRGS